MMPRSFIDSLFLNQIKDAKKETEQDVSQKDTVLNDIGAYMFERIDPKADPEAQFRQLKTLVALKPDIAFVETITPELAKLVLERFTKVNRTLRRPKIAKWAKEMKEAEWGVNAEAIKFLHDGRLGTGQHRLHACVLAGVPFQTYVAFVPTIKGEGQGISQTRSDIFEEHQVKYPRETGKTVAHIRKGGSHKRLPYDPDEDYAFYKEHVSGPKMEEAIKAGKSVLKEVGKLIPEDVLFATLYLLMLKSSSKTLQLVNQIKNNTKSGRVLLRRLEEVRGFIPGGEKGKEYISALIVKAHNANKHGIRLTAVQGPNVLDWDRNTDFPEVL
jgi:hypothetical protein